MEEFCFGYGVSLEGKKGDRRLIGSASMQHIIPLLCDVAMHTVTDLGLYVQLNEEKMAVVTSVDLAFNPLRNFRSCRSN